MGSRAPLPQARTGERTDFLNLTPVVQRVRPRCWPCDVDASGAGCPRSDADGSQSPACLFTAARLLGRTRAPRPRSEERRKRQASSPPQHNMLVQRGCRKITRSPTSDRKPQEPPVVLWCVDSGTSGRMKITVKQRPPSEVTKR